MGNSCVSPSPSFLWLLFRSFLFLFIVFGSNFFEVKIGAGLFRLNLDRPWTELLDSINETIDKDYFVIKGSFFFKEDITDCIDKRRWSDYEKCSEGRLSLFTERIENFPD